MLIELIRNEPNSRKYVITDKNKQVFGYIVVDRYPEKEIEWNLELMQIIPQRKGYGTILLKHVMRDMKTDMTVCPTTKQSYDFFRKNGMNEQNIIINKINQ